MVDIIVIMPSTLLAMLASRMLQTYRALSARAHNNINRLASKD
jgi:hypothetical protein